MCSSKHAVTGQPQCSTRRISHAPTCFGSSKSRACDLSSTLHYAYPGCSLLVRPYHLSNHHQVSNQSAAQGARVYTLYQQLNAVAADATRCARVALLTPSHVQRYRNSNHRTAALAASALLTLVHYDSMCIGVLERHYDAQWAQCSSCEL
jgi:hypothetical protein